MSTLKLTQSEAAELEAIMDRKAGIENVLAMTSADYWREVCRELRDSIVDDDGDNPTSLFDKIRELEQASQFYASARGGANGEFQKMRTVVKRKAQVIEGESIPILVAAAERAVVPLMDDAEAAQAAQDADHEARGIPCEPCPAAKAIRAQAVEVLRRARGGDLSLVG